MSDQPEPDLHGALLEAMPPERRRRYQTLVAMLEVLAAAHAVAQQSGQPLAPASIAATMAVRSRSFYGIAPRIVSDRRQDSGYLIVGLTLRECATIACALVEELGLELAVPHPDEPGEHLR